MCGDSTDEKDVAKLMAGEKADMVFTDPPYNFASDSKNFAGQNKGGWFGSAMSDLKESEWDKDFDIKPVCKILSDNSSKQSTMYVWTSQFLINDIWQETKKTHDFTGYLIWSKTNPMPSISKRHWAWNTEICAYASRGSKRVVNYPKEGNALSCLSIPKKSDGSHPTMKPIELIEPIINFSSNKGQMILDFFLGSGSTLIACEKTGRKCYGMELDEHYMSVIIKRFEEYSGETAVRL
jgi:DNA modification methylase